MAKSNMRSAGIRKHHRRIEHQTRVDRRDRNERVYHQKEQMPMFMQVITLSILATLYGRIRSYASFMSSRFLNQFFRSSRTGIDLDLTKDSVFDTGQRRDAGAQSLRSIWGGLVGFTMVSTRDGKMIR